MKKHIFIAALLGLFMLLAPVHADRQNVQVAVTAGTPVRVSSVKLLVNRLFIQSRTGNTGRIYILMGVGPNTTCDATNTAQLTAELAPGSATAPGGSFSDPQGANGNTPSDAEDLNKICIDGSHTADVAIVSYWRKN